MNRRLLLIGGIGVGALALLFFASRQSAPQVNVAAPEGEVAGIVGAVAGLAGQVISKVDWGKGGSKGGDAAQKAAHSVGLTGDPERSAKAKKAGAAAIQTNLQEAEEWGRLAHQAMAREDCREWVISSSGKNGSPVIYVYLRGKDAPYPVEVPERAFQQRLAWVAEPIVRTLGVWTQRGFRIRSPWIRFDIPAFSDNNPYAPPGTTLSEQRVVAYQFQVKHGQVPAPGQQDAAADPSTTDQEGTSVQVQGEVA